MPILCYEVTGACCPNPRSTTGALDGQLGAVLKWDHEAANAQIYAELAANRLALFLGIPVLVGVPARGAPPDNRLRFACLRVAEAGLDVYDFTAEDRDEFEADDDAPLPSGAFCSGGHVRQVAAMCRKYPLEAASIAVFDLWIGNEDRALNFKAQLRGEKRGVIFALDQGSSLLAARATVEKSLDVLGQPLFPAFHPFQKLVNPRYCGAMVERICSMPDWSILAATTYDDTVGNVTLDEQYAACALLIERKRFLGELVDRILL
ncbi:hypothetical protein [Thiocapsa sp.]|jgi:hypothetical protein|uniref:hypothetical protein n=1 Tax=Thiocapsa sp. TaxID=2024551 RepID=UPI003593C9A5